MDKKQASIADEPIVGIFWYSDEYDVISFTTHEKGEAFVYAKAIEASCEKLGSTLIIPPSRILGEDNARCPFRQKHSNRLDRHL